MPIRRQSRERRPGRYGLASRLATIASTPCARAAARNALPSPRVVGRGLPVRAVELERLEPLAPLRVRALDQALAPGVEEVEGDQGRRRVARAAADLGVGARPQAALERRSRRRAVLAEHRDHPVDRDRLAAELERDREQLREPRPQVLAGGALELEMAGVAERDRARARARRSRNPHWSSLVGSRLPSPASIGSIRGGSGSPATGGSMRWIIQSLPRVRKSA